MNPTLLLAFAALAAVSVGGCLGGASESGGDAGDTPSSSTSSSARPGARPSSGTSTSGQPSPTPGANTTYGSDGNDSANQTVRVWSYDNRSGDVSGIGLFVMQPEANETFTVDDDATQLVLNLSAAGAELTLTLRPPGCDDSACEDSVTTQGGNATLSVPSPDAGAWESILVAEGVGPQEASYEMAIGQLLVVPAGNATQA